MIPPKTSSKAYLLLSGALAQYLLNSDNAKLSKTIFCTFSHRQQFKVMTTLPEQVITRLGLSDEPNMLNKTTELLRLLNLRSTNVPLQLNEYAKVLLCADIAATLLGIAFDKEKALKISSLRKSHYASNKRMIEKLLDLNKIVGVNDICVQLNLAEVSHRALELLELYTRVTAGESADEDFLHPQYAAMAVYCACKLTQQKVSKVKLMGFSNLRPTQWQQLEQRWNRFLSKHYDDRMCKKLQQSHVNTVEVKACASEQQCSKPANATKHAATEVEDYEQWKQRILLMAEKQLAEKQQKEQLNKENVVLIT